MHILILGGGINGSALARELAGRGCGVTLVDLRDLAAGATSASSRLIHGGLRYLEYREFDLVREALGERSWLLRAAPHLVRPLELFIPLAHRTSGLATATRRFFGFKLAAATPAPPRGLWAVRAGLTLYDWYSRGGELPRHAIHSLRGSPSGLPRVAERYRWLCSYYDGQVPFAERLVVEFLVDAERLARQAGQTLTVHTYCEARIVEGRVEIRERNSGTLVAEHPLEHYGAVVNATGAWVDQTLQRLEIPARRLMGGTKGSHIWTDHPGLSKELAGRAIYAEAEDGRVVFVLPFGDFSMIGTTDEPFEGDPEEARASADERQYLLQLVGRVFPELGLGEADIRFHYSGVRPLPYRDWREADPSAVTRDHSVVAHDETPLPVISLIGGKLTTCRALAVDAARFLADECRLKLDDYDGGQNVGGHVDEQAERTGRDAPLPGGDAGFPASTPEPVDETRVRRQLQQSGLDDDQADRHWKLFGSRAPRIVEEAEEPRVSAECIPDCHLTRAAVRHCIRHEWVQTLGDLVERRLMLLYDQRLHRTTLTALANLLVECGKLAASDVAETVERYERDLQQRLGLAVQAGGEPIGEDKEDPS